jgi:NAD(P)-dependent dehydrogenase (short-subunit alcohol dehydrogenase family)
MKKAVIVTGASSGIGAATAIEFSKNNFFVFLTGRNEERLSAVAEQCKAGASILKMDFQKPESIEKYARHLYERPDVEIEVLVNNAGIFESHEFLKGGMDPWLSQFQVNLFATVSWTQKVLPIFLKKNRGAIVNVASTLGIKPIPNTSAYSASKAAMISWTHSLALELGPKGIRVNCVAPGLVDTPIQAFHHLPPEEYKKQKQERGPLQPLGRVGEPDEIAKSIYFLGSDQSSWTTGSVLNVDGGINIT